MGKMGVGIGLVETILCFYIFVGGDISAKFGEKIQLWMSGDLSFIITNPLTRQRYFIYFYQPACCPYAQVTETSFGLEGFVNVWVALGGYYIV